MKVLTFTSLYPDNIWPNHGVFIKERMTNFVAVTGCKVKVVAIDIETGAYAVDENALAAARCLRARQPDAEVWFVRVGHRALHRIGIRSVMERA